MSTDADAALAAQLQAEEQAQAHADTALAAFATSMDRDLAKAASVRSWPGLHACRHACTLQQSSCMHRACSPRALQAKRPAPKKLTRATARRAQCEDAAAQAYGPDAGAA